ncbi:DUF1573 domain-containing protein [Taibaiella koreensis]|uniref:DUF1573 domain-containing protein n=1 Tax=Taibaiella koreensis TaxID=1268548 RepID=UPI000E59ED10|nr:DUF1573 domain-containing protein [Taibaiella koreensis]
MKRILTAFMIVAASTAVVHAQKGAKFEFKDKNDAYDFGTVKEGEKVVHVFEFKNAGDQPLQILKVEAGCGCTTPEWPKTPVMPGKSSSIKVTFNTAGKVGPAYKDVTIKSNAVLADKSKERYTLILKGSVIK